MEVWRDGGKERPHIPRSTPPHTHGASGVGIILSLPKTRAEGDSRYVEPWKYVRSSRHCEEHAKSTLPKA